MLTRDGRFPHLLPVDAAVWLDHLKAHAHDYTQIIYDVRVGEGRDPGPEFDQGMRSMALALSCRRIDVVAHRPGGLDIIEVTHSAGFTAIGQLISYPILYAQTFTNAPSLRPVLVAGALQTDIQPVLDRLGIQYYIYPLSLSLSEPRSQSDSTPTTD